VLDVIKVEDLPPELIEVLRMADRMGSPSRIASDSRMT
jgi:hypothetical protein